ncbi:MAG: S26 family signal peptidase [Clostridia bacterium]|nr:S26 family signal peptidase [Clostridia bacterium]
MGDNRNNSNDSRNDLGDRAVGQVSKDLIVGKAVFRWWPVNKAGVLH